MTREDVDANSGTFAFRPKRNVSGKARFLRQRLSGLALVPVVKSSDLRNHNDAPGFCFLNCSRLRGVLGECEMSSGVLIQISNTKHIRPTFGKSTIPGTLSTNRESPSILNFAVGRESLCAVVLMAAQGIAVLTSRLGCLTAPHVRPWC